MFIDLETIFKEFISVIQENNKYIIGLLDHHYTVILCSEEAYLGQRLDVQHPDETNTYYKIDVKRESYGYLWVSGQDDSLKMISGLLYESLTTRILYECNEKMLNHKVTKDDTLVKYLIDVHEFNAAEVVALVEELGIHPDIARVALLVVSERGFDSEEIVRLKLREDNQEIIFSLLDKHTLLIFKDVPELSEYHTLKQNIGKYITSLQDWGLNDCRFFAGSMQRKLSSYNTSYENCLWLQENGYGRKQRAVFFEDVVFDYAISQVDLEDIYTIFEFYKEQSRGLRVEELVEITNQLMKNDYNITQTADDLFLHKNTLIYKIKKYEEMFNIDVRSSFEGKVILSLISRALSHQLQKQVGEKL